MSGSCARKHRFFLCLVLIGVSAPIPIFRAVSYSLEPASRTAESPSARMRARFPHFNAVVDDHRLVVLNLTALRLDTLPAPPAIAADDNACGLPALGHPCVTERIAACPTLQSQSIRLQV